MDFRVCGDCALLEYGAYIIDCNAGYAARSAILLKPYVVIFGNKKSLNMAVPCSYSEKNAVMLKTSLTVTLCGCDMFECHRLPRGENELHRKR